MQGPALILHIPDGQDLFRHCLLPSSIAGEPQENGVMTVALSA